MMEQEEYVHETAAESSSDQLLSLLLLETFPFSLRRDALEIMLPAATSLQMTVLLNG